MSDLLSLIGIALILVAIIGGWWRFLDGVKRMIEIVRERLKS